MLERFELANNPANVGMRILGHNVLLENYARRQRLLTLEAA